MSLLYEKESYEIRGACFWVWKEFGSAFKESIMDNALTEELIKRKLKVENQKRINIYYNGKKVGVYVPDKIINEAIIIEVKSKPYLTNQDIKQFWHYLKGTKYKLGFLVNFGERLEIKRVVYDAARIREKISVRDPREDQRKGFTLVEIIVATAIFIVVSSAMMTLFNYMLKINRRSEALRQATQGSRDFVEFLVKEVRNGQIGYGLVDPGGSAQSTSLPSPCVIPTVGSSTYTNKDNKLALVNIGGEEECIYYGDANGDPVGNLVYSVPGGKIMLAKSTGIRESINPPNYTVENLMFLVRPTCDPYTIKPPGCTDYSSDYPRIQPFVTMILKFVVRLPTGESVPIYYQTSVDTSKFDIPH